MSKGLHATDFVVLLMVLLGAMTTAHAAGLTDPRAMTALVVGWTCPAAWRLLAWRRGRQAVWQPAASNRLMLALMIGVGGGLWMLDPIARSFHSTQLLDASQASALSFAIGAVLTLGGLVNPRRQRPAVRD